MFRRLEEQGEPEPCGHGSTTNTDGAKVLNTVEACEQRGRVIKAKQCFEVEAIEIC